MDWSHEALSDAPFTAPVPPNFLFKKCVQRPFNAIKEVFRQEQSKFVGIWNVHRLVEAAGTELVRWSWSAFVMQNVDETLFVFGKNCWVERNFVPIGECVTGFETECSILEIAIVSLDVIFDGDIDSVRQADFNFLSPMMVRTAEVDDIIFVDQAGINGAGWEDICICQRRETRLRKASGRAVRTRQRFSSHFDIRRISDLRSCQRNQREPGNNKREGNPTQWTHK